MAYPYPQVDLSDVVETGTIQLFELEKFADALGFEFNGSSYIRVRGTMNSLLKTVTVLSTNNMIRMYNTKDERSWSNCGRYSFFNLNSVEIESVTVGHDEEGNALNFDFGTEGNLVPFYAKDVENAFAGQDITRLKIQLSKKGLTVLSHKIEFYDPETGEGFQDAVNALKTQQQVEVV